MIRFWCIDTFPGTTIYNVRVALSLPLQCLGHIVSTIQPSLFPVLFLMCSRGTAELTPSDLPIDF